MKLLNKIIFYPLWSISILTSFFWLFLSMFFFLGLKKLPDLQKISDQKIMHIAFNQAAIIFIIAFCFNVLLIVIGFKKWKKGSRKIAFLITAIPVFSFLILLLVSHIYGPK